MIGSYGFGLWMMGMWFFFILIAIMVYNDAERRGRSDSLLWFLLLLIPMVSIFALFMYLIIRNDDTVKYSPQGNPISVLDERYARGEIDRTNYSRMKDDLRRGV